MVDTSCFGITPQIKISKEVRTNPSPKSSNERTSIETCICSGRREGPYAQIEVTKSEKGTSFET